MVHMPITGSRRQQAAYPPDPDQLLRGKATCLVTSIRPTRRRSCSLPKVAICARPRGADPAPSQRSSLRDFPKRRAPSELRAKRSFLKRPGVHIPDVVVPNELAEERLCLVRGFQPRRLWRALALRRLGEGARPQHAALVVAHPEEPTHQRHDHKVWNEPRDKRAK